MKYYTLPIASAEQLNFIQEKISKEKQLTTEDLKCLEKLLAGIPTAEKLIIESAPVDEPVKLSVISYDDPELKQWVDLFANVPGWDYAGFSYLVDEDKEMLEQNVIIVAHFAPSMAYNLNNNRSCEVWLKDDGSAQFFLRFLETAEQYPELYKFRGTWKEAYFLLVETFKRGWPIEEFPEELQQFLKK